MASNDNDAELEALLAAVLAAYLLTDDEVTSLAERIYAGRIAAFSAVYKAIATGVGAVVPGDWEVPKRVLSRLADLAHQNARGVADTLERDLRAAGLAFLLAWRDDHDGAVAGAGVELRQHLGQTADERAGWKAEQIATSETNQAGSTAVSEAAGDLEDGTLLDADGQPINTEELVCAVLPDGAAEEFCIEYAGNFYPFSAYEDLTAIFPAHPNCDHEVDVLVYQGGDVSQDWSLDTLWRRTRAA